MFKEGKNPIFLDHQSTTPVDPRVIDAMMPFLTTNFANPGSPHKMGIIAADAVEDARSSIQQLIGAKRGRVVFTSSATEAINIAIFSLIIPLMNPQKRHIVSGAIEHSAIIECLKEVEKIPGWTVSYAPPTQEGMVTLASISNMIRPDTGVVVLQHGNSEVGSLNPIEDIGKLCKNHGILFMVDASQTLGKIPINVSRMNIDSLIMSSHKLYGPKGAAGLYESKIGLDSRHRAFIHGGGEYEYGIRAGTPNVPAIVGFSRALQLCSDLAVEESLRLASLSMVFLGSLRNRIPDIILNGPLIPSRLPGNLSLTIPLIDNKWLIHSLHDKVAFSPSSACSGNSFSHVLSRIGLGIAEIKSTIRIGIGRFNTEEECTIAADAIAEAVMRHRNATPQN